MLDKNNSNEGNLGHNKIGVDIKGNNNLVHIHNRFNQNRRTDGLKPNQSIDDSIHFLAFVVHI